MSNDYSFYASLHAYANDNQSKPYKYNSMLNYISQDTNKPEESNTNNESHEAEGLVNPTTDLASFKLFLETIKQDYENC
ncbi:9348_t:CDS:2, partial [Dentiscutata heterogama]